MERARAKDWLIGAVGMLVVLAVVIVIFWLIVSEPAGDGGTQSERSPAAVGQGSSDAQPPADLQDGEVWLADLALDAGTLVTGDSMLRDVQARGHDVVTGQGGLVASRVTIDATVPFEVVAEELEGDSVVRAAEGGQAEVVRTIDVLGRELRVVATGTVEVEDGALVVEPRSIDIGGPDFLADLLADIARGLVTIEHDIEGLPEGVVLHDVTVQDDGFRAHLRGQDVELVP